MRLLLVGLWCFGQNLFAQTAEQDLQRVLEPLVNAEQLYFENEFLYFQGNETTPSEKLTGVFHRNGTQEYVSMDQFEGLISRDYIVAVDHEDRIVSAQRNAPLQSLNKLFDTEKIRELIQTQNASVQYVSSNGSWKGIEIIDPENTKEKLTLYFEPFSFIIKEVRIATVDPFSNPWEVTEGIMIVVRYLNYSTLAKPFPYKMENYIRKSGNHFVPSGKCKGYQLL